MPVPEIKAAIKQLLENNIPALKSVETQYSRITTQMDTPNAVIWDYGMVETRMASGGGMPRPNYTAGLKKQERKICTHVRMFGGDPNVDGPLFDQLIEDIEKLYRGYPDLDGLANTEISKILTFGETITHDRLTLDINVTRVLWQVQITCSVTEILNG